MLVGSPIWNVRPPMIMATFLESHDFTAKSVHPFVTYAVSGLGRTEAAYSPFFSGPRLQPGLTVQGEDVPDHRNEVQELAARGRFHA